MRSLQRPGRYLVFFDLDGTLYPLRGGSYRRSPLRAAVRSNACQFLAKRLRVSLPQARRTLRNIERTYGEDISIGIEWRFHINRQEYFRAVWNIPARRYVTAPRDLRRLIVRIRRRYNIAVISDAPSVWVHRVLRTLRVEDCFRGRVLSGEGDARKGFGNAFRALVTRYRLDPKRCIVVGDQEATDIIPARAAGMRTILVSRRCRRTGADACIRNLNELDRALTHLTRAGMRGTTGARRTFTT